VRVVRFGRRSGPVFVPARACLSVRTSNRAKTALPCWNILKRWQRAWISCSGTATRVNGFTLRRVRCSMIQYADRPESGHRRPRARGKL